MIYRLGTGPASSGRPAVGILPLSSIRARLRSPMLSAINVPSADAGGDITKPWITCTDGDSALASNNGKWAWSVLTATNGKYAHYASAVEILRSRRNRRVTKWPLSAAMHGHGPESPRSMVLSVLVGCRQYAVVPRAHEHRLPAVPSRLLAP